MIQYRQKLGTHLSRNSSNAPFQDSISSIGRTRVSKPTSLGHSHFTQSKSMAMGLSTNSPGLVAWPFQVFPQRGFNHHQSEQRGIHRPPVGDEISIPWHIFPACFWNLGSNVASRNATPCSPTSSAPFLHKSVNRSRSPKARPQMKGARTTSPFRQIRPLNQTHAGINGSGLQHGHIGTRIHPRQIGFVQPLFAAPPFI